MPIETVPGTELSYHLIAFDEQGRERTDDPDGLMSRRAVEALAGETFTDVFIFSHGWKGDVPSARAQYSAWIAAMAAHSAGREQIRQARPGFRPLLIGFHWPSLPFGDEELAAPVSFGPADATDAPPIADLVERYAARIADTPAARAALETIFAAAQIDPNPPTLPPDVRQAYEVLNRESGLGSGGPSVAPGDDREPFDAETAYHLAAEEGLSFGPGGFDLGGLLAPLRELSFWKMKDRGRSIGESGGHDLLRQLQEAAPDARFHLMGHSFGCAVVSAILGGPDGRGALVRPVDSVALVQGAISFWSYCTEIPYDPRGPGYFRSIVADGKVRGPILTTRSELDTAVGKLYPLAAGVASQVSFGPGEELPKYGALGTFGIRGPGLDLVDLEMLPADQSYGFEPGKVYNLDCNAVIREGPPPSGAHGDFLRPEVANAVWEAART